MASRESTADFDRIHAEHREAVAGYLRRLTRNETLSEELAQETFLRVSRGLSGFRGASKISTWVYRIATNVYLDHCRQQGSRGRQAAKPPLPLEDAPEAEAAAPAAVLPDRLFEESEMGDCVRRFVDGLPPESRAVIVLHDLQGLTNAEVARVLDSTLESVKIRVHRARRMLGELLKEHCDFERDADDVLRCDRKQPGPS